MVLAALTVGLTGTASLGQPASAASRTEVTILLGAPTSLDPAGGSDISSAAFSAQLFESLTAFDQSLTLRPALARSWDISDDGRRIVFHLRAGLAFSDGAPISAEDVVQSWLRIINPARPSQLASLLLDVTGAADYLTGRSDDPQTVGLRSDGLDVIVDLDGPGADFPSIVASPTFGIVPAQVWRDGADVDADGPPSSGAYVVEASSGTAFTLVANPQYWAGQPPITTIHVLTEIGGRSRVSEFEAGDLDYTAIGSADASWIQYEATLGPQLRLVPSLSLSFVGFTANRAPFDDVRIRKAFAAAVDWARATDLASNGDDVPADSMVPPGVPGGGDRNWVPAHDPALGRRLLQEAGFPGGVGMPVVTFAVGGIAQAEGIVEDLRRELGVRVRIEELDDHFGRLQTDPPDMWSLGWVADYPGANDFLGVLLGTGSTNNYGRWSSGAFDAAISAALATRDPIAARAAYERALGVVRDEVPVVPLAYGDGWALSREGLLGADQNGLGILRLAGLAWE